MSEKKADGPEWPIDLRCGLMCFGLLVALELLVAAGGKVLGVQDERSVYLTTLGVRALDVLLIIYFLRRHGLGPGAVGLSGKLWKKGFWHGLIWGAASAAWGALVFGRMVMNEIRDFSFLPGMYNISILTVLVGIVIGPAVEELVFRGWLYGALRNRYHAVVSLLLSSLLFSLAHGLEPSRLALGFLGGLLFGASYELSRSLITPLMLHIGGNAVLNIVIPVLFS